VVIRDVASCHEYEGDSCCIMNLVDVYDLDMMGGGVTSPPNPFFSIINTLIRPLIMGLTKFFLNCII
jgi:hypothetical protein